MCAGGAGTGAGAVMTANPTRYVYGPVPSRRLGRSLGVDLVPLKTCSYDCVYCQLGPTSNPTTERREYAPVRDVLSGLQATLASGSAPDYISLAGSGEPTLHSGIGEIIRGIKAMSAVPVAVLTNGSLLWREDVQRDLLQADLVLPSLDAGDEAMFRRVNRPHGGVSFAQVVDGLASFTRQFSGDVWLEVFLLGGLTAEPHEARKIAALVRRIAPTRVQLNTVTRPPADPSARRVGLKALEGLASLFPGDVDVVCEAPWGHAPAGAAPAAIRDDIMAMLARRPCTAADVANGLGVPPNEAIKHLDAPVSEGVVGPRVVDGRCYYAAVGGQSAAPPSTEA